MTEGAARDVRTARVPLNQGPVNGLVRDSSQPSAAVEEIVRSFVEDHQEAAAAAADVDGNGTQRCNGNVKVLVLTSALFITITVVQYWAAMIARSEALKADCISMAVDAMTYFFNIACELTAGTRVHRPLTMIMPTISLTVLVYFTQDVVQESLGTLRQSEKTDDGEVNGAIVLVFALFGLLFDIVSIVAFYRNRRRGEGGAQVNMMTAFAHVAADFARSTTTLVESIIIALFPLDGVATDAWAALVVSAIILVGAVAAFIELLKDITKYRRTGQ